MKKSIMIFGLMLALTATMALSAGATMITGAVSFSGGFTTNNDQDNLATATAFTSFTEVKVDDTGAGTGDLSALVNNTLLTVTPFAFSPFTAPNPNWWQATIGQTTYSFSLTTRQIDFQGANSILLSGFGTMRIEGSGNYTDTPGTWVLSANNSGTTASFSGGSAAAVPEPATLLLLGFGLIGVAGFVSRKNLKK